jgi:hypothetical protein
MDRLATIFLKKRNCRSLLRWLLSSSSRQSCQNKHVCVVASVKWCAFYILVSLLLKIYKEIDVGSALLALAFDVVAGRVLNWL